MIEINQNSRFVRYCAFFNDDFKSDLNWATRTDEALNIDTCTLVRIFAKAVFTSVMLAVVLISGLAVVSVFGQHLIYGKDIVPFSSLIASIAGLVVGVSIVAAATAAVFGVIFGIAKVKSRVREFFESRSVKKEQSTLEKIVEAKLSKICVKVSIK